MGENCFFQICLYFITVILVMYLLPLITQIGHPYCKHGMYKIFILHLNNSYTLSCFNKIIKSVSNRLGFAISRNSLIIKCDLRNH